MKCSNAVPRLKGRDKGEQEEGRRRGRGKKEEDRGRDEEATGAESHRTPMDTPKLKLPGTLEDTERNDTIGSCTIQCI